MAIAASSRYASSTVVPLDRNGQVVNVIVPSQQFAVTFSYLSHMITDDDRLDRLANQYYGDPGQWWQIADANPDAGIDWSNIPAGTIIRIPFS